MVRRAERSLLSYERSGWLEDEPTRITQHFETRPSSEMGPIICCLDTSGSMHGARETVAKVEAQRYERCISAKARGIATDNHVGCQAVTLECMRGAYRQNRQCFLYAFGGPGEVQELQLDLRPGALEKLLGFLRFSFGGGTDVDRPLEMSLERLQHNDWKQARQPFVGILSGLWFSGRRPACVAILIVFWSANSERIMTCHVLCRRQIF